MAAVLFAAVLVLAAIVFLWARPSRGGTRFALLHDLAALDAGRTVTQEEYDFFAGVAAKQGIGEDADSVKAYIGSINAEFYLGSQLGLCEPFDYASFQYRTQAENNDRAMKKLAGQVYYGPDSFTEESYFEYLHSCLRSDILTWLVDHRDEDMVRRAEAFFHENEERFAPITSVTYEITEDGVTETKTMENTVFKTMGQSDPTLMDFLSQAQDGEETVLNDGTGRRVKRIGITTELASFASQERFVVEIWLMQEVMDELIAAIAQNSGLVF